MFAIGVAAYAILILGQEFSSGCCFDVPEVLAVIASQAFGKQVPRFHELPLTMTVFNRFIPGKRLVVLAGFGGERGVELA